MNWLSERSAYIPRTSIASCFAAAVTILPVLKWRPRAGSSGRVRARAIMLTLLLAIGSSAVTAAEEIRIAGTSAAMGTMQMLATRFIQSNPNVKITVVGALASEGGLKAVLSGAIDLALSSRPLNGEEIRSGLSQFEYARTPFVFAVPVASAVGSITRQELADIYSGRMVQWPDGSAVRVVMRPANNPNNELVKRLGAEIRKGVSAAENRPGMRVVITDEETADNLERSPGAIGALSLSLILSEKRPLKALKLDGVEPTPANAASKAYPLYKPLYFVTGARHRAVVERFVAFVRSPAGRKIINDNGQWIP